MNTSDTDTEYQQQAEASLREAREELARLLTAKGVAQDRATALLEEHADRVRVTPKVGGPQVEVIFPTGMQPGRMGIKALAGELAHRATLLDYGPDPAHMLAERMEALGVPQDEALHYARLYAWRERDGRISVKDTRGTVFSRGDSADLDWLARQHATACKDRAGWTGSAKAGVHYVL